jgi:hypothetical protein
LKSAYRKDLSVSWNEIRDTTRGARAPRSETETVGGPRIFRSFIVGRAFARRYGLARNGGFVEPDQADATSPVLFAKIFLFSYPPNHF